MDKKEYREYLESPEWKATRAKALERGDNKCAVCGRTDTLEVHHNTYDRIGAELPTDLVVLCNYHHSTIHTCQERDENYGIPRMCREDVESHIRCFINSIAPIKEIVNPHYRRIARDAVINDLVDTFHLHIDPGAVLVQRIKSNAPTPDFPE